ncbi:MAG: putative toxin-antitoxin system toxin component, PIN family [Lentisphaeria bacterium]|nr:putative toxin-antitoxin system toxin component, PIN family [Lentisphaeria bacterium]
MKKALWNQIKKTAFESLYGVTYIKGMPELITIDTNVLVAALQSSLGASYRLLRELEKEAVRAAISVPLFYEYEEVLGRFVKRRRISENSKELILDYFCAHAVPVDIHFLWRPFLNDADDNMVLECALSAGTRYIVTHNIKDFIKAHELGVQPVSPGNLLKQLGLLP